MKIVVTGASGYIGRHLVKELLDRGNHVYAVSLETIEIDKRLQWLDTNIFSGSETIFEELGSPDLVLHLAWKDGFVHNSVEHMKNLSDHYMFITGLAKGGCKNIGILGSMHEIGYYEGCIDATTPCNPLSEYGIAKNTLRQSVELLKNQYGFNLYWLRAYYIYGDDYKASSIFSKILKAEDEGKKKFPFTTGKNRYDFIEIRELAKQISDVTTQDKYTGIINVCSGEPMSLGDMINKFIKDNGLNIELDYGCFPDRKYDSPEVYGDASVIRRIRDEKIEK